MPFHAKVESAIVLLLDGPENYQKISVVYPRKNPGLLQDRSVPDRGKALPARRTKGKQYWLVQKCQFIKIPRNSRGNFANGEFPGIPEQEFPVALSCTHRYIPFKRYISVRVPNNPQLWCTGPVIRLFAQCLNCRRSLGVKPPQLFS